ncbi:MAG TPA: type II toxin-antitoxin system PemK/MazF family toxin [Tepidisphaeraceae bacterium]|nr:type II toxin-antitoxin system PemK/MazF family toxin [Tepidisphaeraceae bacterium]
MSKQTFHPDRGDLIAVNFQPAAGREIDKRRPAIVLSPLAYNRRTGLCVIVPTTTSPTPTPFSIPLPDGYLGRPSLVLCDYVKNIDYRERSASLIRKMPIELVNEIVSTIIDLIDPIA